MFVLSVILVASFVVCGCCMANQNGLEISVEEFQQKIEQEEFQQKIEQMEENEGLEEIVRQNDNMKEEINKLKTRVIELEYSVSKINGFIEGSHGVVLDRRRE